VNPEIGARSERGPEIAGSVSRPALAVEAFPGRGEATGSWNARRPGIAIPVCPEEKEKTK